MPVITKGEHAREILELLIGEKRSIPCFCTESVYTTEAIFRGAMAFRQHLGITGNLPLIIAFTASYRDRQQLRNYTGLADFREGMLAVRSDIERLSRSDGPYADLDVIVHLDHAQPGEDNWILESHPGFISSVMWDCSHFGINDNIRMVKDFVSGNKASFVIEGAVDEIYNYSPDGENLGIMDHITRPDLAEKYFRETGCDLVVANLGTEHRRTEGTVRYHGDVAREISSRIGHRLVLHGTSSISEEELKNLPGDGIVKVNLWGNLEAKPGKKLARTLIQNLEHILSREEIEQLIKEGYLHEKMRDRSYKPSIHYLTEKYRRDEIYLPEAISTVYEFYSALYGKPGRQFL
jgi:fructose/tagatose bisphosphate aldolase